MPFEQARLDNDLTIIAETNPSAASMAVGFFVRTGSRDETGAVSGVSHFLEHMMFKGTQRRGPADINRQFDQMGALYNAFTSEENTVYYAAVLPEFQQPLLDLLGDMLRPALRQEDFETERKVILEEIALYQDRPQHRLFEKLMAQHFGRHPLSHSVLGTPESISAMKRQDMLDYVNRRYSPGNVTLVASGNLDWPGLVAQAGRVCGHWASYPVSRAVADAAGTRKVELIVDAKLMQENVGLMSPAPSAQDERRYAAHLLSAILGDATGSRLFYALIEPALAEEASCVYEELDGTGLLVTFIAAEPARAWEALKIVRREYAAFLRTGPTEVEMTAAKNKIAAGATLRGELPMGRLTAVGFDWVYRRTYKPLPEQIEQILSVTGEQVLELARQINPVDATVLALGPNEKIDF